MSGSEAATIHMLKAWVVRGLSLPNKAAHKAVWSQITSSKKAGALPESSELERLLQRHASAAAAGSGASGSGVRARRVRGKQRAGVANVSDVACADAGTGSQDVPAAPQTPEAVRARMQRLIEQGSIPSTSVDQRRRNRRTQGTRYGVPKPLQEALEYSYIHPNLQPPLGFEWKMVGHKKLALVPRGG